MKFGTEADHTHSYKLHMKHYLQVNYKYGNGMKL
jgi:hypothetical protein